MKLFFDARWIGDHGIGRFAREVRARLPDVCDLSAAASPSSPFDTAYLAMCLRALPSNAFFYSPGYSAPLATRVPFVFTIHDLAHIDFPGSRTALKAFYYERIMKPACRRARAVLTVSEYSKARIRDWSGVNPARIINVGNGVARSFCTSGNTYAHPRPYVLCVGNRKPHKNELRMLRAFAAVAHRVPHDLLFSGLRSGDLSHEIGALHLEDRVAFVGHVSDQQMACLYRGASALLFASLYEGFGLPVIEAMSCGTPVIVSNVCALPEVAADAALLVDPRSVEEIAAALARLLSDSSLSQTLIRRGVANARRYTWERTGSAVLQAIEACQQ
jgi:glycosyltransferase involved in cell wall biosynthesis